MTAKTDTLLVEIGVEELPPASLTKLGDAFGKAFAAALDEAGFEHGEVRDFCAPRRLAVRVSALAAEQPDRVTERKGPAVAQAFTDDGKPKPAAAGFAKACGVSVDDLQQVEGRLVCQVTEPGKRLANALPELVEQALAALPVARRMRWGNKDHEFVRPVRWVCALYGAQALELTVMGVHATPHSRGLRGADDKPVRVVRADEYEETLKSANVIVSFAERRKRIEAEAVELARSVGARALINPQVADEAAALTEWPRLLLADFERDFLEKLPEVVVQYILEKEVRVFPLRETDGKLAPRFVLIANFAGDDTAAIKTGFERVVRARLADAAFCFERDAEQTLESRRGQLDEVVFIKQLGSLAGKSWRIGALVLARLAGPVGAFAIDFKRIAAPLSLLADKNHRTREFAKQLVNAVNALIADLKRAAELCKCDQVSEMVIEYPALEGAIGEIYAKRDGEIQAVSGAIREQYLPRWAGDRLPETPVGIALALADRADTLVSVLGMGETPSGDKDPYGLRRTAIGIIRILTERQVELNLANFFLSAARLRNLAARYQEELNLANFFARSAVLRDFMNAGMQYDKVVPHASRKDISEHLEEYRSVAELTAQARRANAFFNTIAAPGADDPSAVTTSDTAPGANVVLTQADSDLAQRALVYVMDRLKVYHADRGAPPDQIAAVEATGCTSPLDFDRRLKALAEFTRLPEATRLSAANKRISNILKDTDPGELSAELLSEDAERDLHKACCVAGPLVNKYTVVNIHTNAKQYLEALRTLTPLCDPIDHFFDEVLVMAEDPAIRQNRLALLATVGKLLCSVADISKLEVEKS